MDYCVFPTEIINKIFSYIRIGIKYKRTLCTNLRDRYQAQWIQFCLSKKPTSKEATLQFKYMNIDSGFFLFGIGTVHAFIKVSDNVLEKRFTVYCDTTVIHPDKILIKQMIMLNTWEFSLREKFDILSRRKTLSAGMIKEYLLVNQCTKYNNFRLYHELKVFIDDDFNTLTKFCSNKKDYLIRMLTTKIYEIGIVIEL